MKTLFILIMATGFILTGLKGLSALESKHQENQFQTTNNKQEGEEDHSVVIKGYWPLSKTDFSRALCFGSCANTREECLEEAGINSEKQSECYVAFFICKDDCIISVDSETETDEGIDG